MLVILFYKSVLLEEKAKESSFVVKCQVFATRRPT